MKYLNVSIIVAMVFSSCIFTDKPNVIAADEFNSHDYADADDYVRSDSITVDTTIGNYHLFYRIKDRVDTTIVTFSCDEDQSASDQYRVDKSILLNIQKTDTTSVVAYETIRIESFAPILKEENIKDYAIEQFCLKEVNEGSIVFVAKLCEFGKDICKDIKLVIADDGTINYISEEKIA